MTSRNRAAVTGLKAKGGIFYGWWIVVAAGAISLYGAGVYFYALGAFFDPIRKEFG